MHQRITIKKSDISLSITFSSTQDDDSFTFNSEERHNKLHFGDLLTLQKDDKHIRILFQNFNSLEISLSRLSIEDTCNEISHHELDIACLVKTNTT